MNSRLVAFILMLSGIVLTYISFCTPPKGSVDETILFYFTETLVWGGGAFGLGDYVIKLIEYIRCRKS